MSRDKKRRKVKFVPSTFQILHGFKTTGDLVPLRYKFDTWYEEAVHVIPRDLETIKRYPESYEMHKLYPCEYVFDHAVPHTAFQISKFIKVFDEPTCVVLHYDGRITIGGEDFS